MKAWEGLEMTNADWWARVVQARTERADLRPRRVWTLHKGEHAAAIDLEAVPGIGAEIVLTVDGEWRKTRLFRSHEQAELVGASRTRAMFEGRGARDGMNDAARTCERVAAIERNRWHYLQYVYDDLSTHQTDGYRSLSHNDIVTELHRQRLKPHVSSDYLSEPVQSVQLAVSPVAQQEHSRGDRYRYL